ncbi:MAG: hypothetical protein ACRED5_07050 [Propylenella sp.]
MRNTLIAAAAVAALAPAQALATPKDDMCEFVSILASEGASAAMTYIDKLADLWPPEQRAKLGPVVGSEMEKFDYRGGQIYQTAVLPGVVEEYFLTLNLTGGGSVYLRVLYEGNARDALAFINVNFWSSYHSAVEDPFLQAPQPVTCP